MFKKVCLIAVILMGMFALVPVAADAAAAAGDKIGVIDSRRAISQHPMFESANKEMQSLAMKKEGEVRPVVEKEPDERKRQQLILAMRDELATEDQRLFGPIFKDAELAVRTVAKNKGLTIIMEKSSVYVGGVDITDDVIQQIKKQALLK